VDGALWTSSSTGSPATTLPVIEAGSSVITTSGML
jgi:hypothetical protein